MSYEPFASSEQASLRYQVPTHLNVPDHLALPLLGVTVQVTMRQGLILLVGGSLAFHLWQHLAGIAEGSQIGSFVRLLLVGSLLLITLGWTMCTVAGRPLEDWLVILLRYHRFPRIYVWQPIPVPLEQVERASRGFSSGETQITESAEDEATEEQEGWQTWERRAA